MPAVGLFRQKVRPAKFFGHFRQPRECKVECRELGSRERTQHHIVEAHRLGEQLFIEFSTAFVEFHDGTTLVASYPQPRHQFLGYQVGKVPRNPASTEGDMAPCAARMQISRHSRRVMP